MGTNQDVRRNMMTEKKIRCLKKSFKLILAAPSTVITIIIMGEINRTYCTQVRRRAIKDIETKNTFLSV
jgi:hypothetical protein